MSLGREVIARPAEGSDVEAICLYLQNQPGSKITAAEWRALFVARWSPEADYGQMLLCGREVVGYLGSIISERDLAGTREIICNLTAWYVDQAYRARGGALSLLLPYLQRRDWTITNLTPTKFVSLLFQRLGFQILETEKFILPRSINLPRKAHLQGIRISANPQHIRHQVSPEHQKILDDHLPHGCGVFLAQIQGDQAFIVTKRRVKRGLPLSEILYCSRSDILMGALERVKAVILSSQRTVALVADRRFFDARPSLALRYSRPALFRSPRLTPGALDNLYSELVLLPI